MQLPVVRLGNSKLGNLIHQWSITPGIAASCICESGVCASRCYAKRGFFRMSNSQTMQQRNFEFSKTLQFKDWMTSHVKHNFISVMRVHVAGDFYSPAYVAAWRHVVQHNPQTKFFAYTRSWRSEAVLPELIQLGQLSNFSLWWSSDRETGPAPLVPGIRHAYMAINDTDARHAPSESDLVFRDSPTTVMKKASGVQVCPPENGVKLKRKITCSSCGICWDRQDITNWEPLLMDDIFDVEIQAPITQERVTDACART